MLFTSLSSLHLFLSLYSSLQLPSGCPLRHLVKCVSAGEVVACLFACVRLCVCLCVTVCSIIECVFGLMTVLAVVDLQTPETAKKKGVERYCIERQIDR